MIRCKGCGWVGEEDELKEIDDSITTEFWGVEQTDYFVHRECPECECTEFDFDFVQEEELEE